jgi:hypothetical protein
MASKTKKPKPAPRMPTRRKKASTLLTGGNPQIAKGAGDKPVQAYIAALPGWKGATAAQLDALISRAAPKAQKAIKWNSPFYGMPGQGWFLAVHAFTHYVKVTFFRGTSLTPVPPGVGTHAEARWLDVREGELDTHAKQLTAWVKQAAKIPGWQP